MADLEQSLARRYQVIRPHLNEFQRRLWLGAEAAELGAGGVAVVARETGVAADTVRRPDGGGGGKGAGAEPFTQAGRGVSGPRLMTRRCWRTWSG